MWTGGGSGAQVYCNDFRGEQAQPQPPFYLPVSPLCPRAGTPSHLQVRTDSVLHVRAYAIRHRTVRCYLVFVPTGRICCCHAARWSIRWWRRFIPYSPWLSACNRKSCSCPCMTIGFWGIECCKVPTLEICPQNVKCYLSIKLLFYSLQLPCSPWINDYLSSRSLLCSRFCMNNVPGMVQTRVSRCVCLRHCFTHHTSHITHHTS